MGDDNEVTLTHVADTGILLNGANVIQLRDSAINIGSPADGDLDINADDEIELNSTLIDINGNVEISGTAVTTGVHTFTAVPVFPNNTIETADIQADAITAAKIADNAVVTAGINADAVTAAKIADNAVVTAGINADAVTAAKIADDAISEEHLDVTAVTGHTAETTVADGDLVVIHDASASALRKMTVANLVANAGGGKVLQVLSSVDTTGRTTTSTSFASMTLNGNITPSATSSKVFAIVQATMGVRGNYNATFDFARSINGASHSVAEANGAGQCNAVNSDNHDTETPGCMLKLDSPNTTSVVNYRVDCKVSSGGTGTLGKGGYSTMILIEIGA